MSSRVLVTGATGFVGRTLCDRLARSGHVVRAAVRRDHRLPETIPERVIVGDIGPATSWDEALAGVDYVIHAAARAHVLDDSPGDSARYEQINAFGTERLAAAAAAAAVRRFVYLSSVKVNGEETSRAPYTALDPPHPRDAYGRSKLLGEQALARIGSQQAMAWATVRAPLVYGPGVRANFLRLLRWVDKGIPLPFGSVSNVRSLVSVWNLCDLLIALLDRDVDSRVWMVSDGQDVSTPELIRATAAAMRRRARLIPVPVGLLVRVGALAGRGAEMRRLCGSLAVDIRATREGLGWSPAMSMQDALELTVHWYLTEGRARGG